MSTRPKHEHMSKSVNSKSELSCELILLIKEHALTHSDKLTQMITSSLGDALIRELDLIFNKHHGHKKNILDKEQNSIITGLILVRPRPMNHQTPLLKSNE